MTPVNYARLSIVVMIGVYWTLRTLSTFFLQLPPAIIPRFVAENLSLLPPLSMDCFNISRVVKDIETIKSQIDDNASKPHISKMHNVQETQNTVSKQTRNILFATSIYAILIDFAFEF